MYTMANYLHTYCTFLFHCYTNPNFNNATKVRILVTKCFIFFNSMVIIGVYISRYRDIHCTLSRIASCSVSNIIKSSIVLKVKKPGCANIPAYVQLSPQSAAILKGEKVAFPCRGGYFFVMSSASLSIPRTTVAKVIAIISASKMFIGLPSFYRGFGQPPCFPVKLHRNMIAHSLLLV